MSQVGFKQFKIEGCCSYLLFDPSSRDAAVVDPHLGLMNEYRSYIAERGLKLRLVLETHTQSDHYSSSHLFRAETGAEIAMAPSAGSLRASRRLKDRETLPVGSLALTALLTPGHTEDSVCYLGHGLLFTGDTLWINERCRVDYECSDPVAQERSLASVLAKLPPETVVLPAHHSGEILFSTIGVELRRNPDFRSLSLQDRRMAPDPETARRIGCNRQASPSLSNDGEAHSTIPHSGPRGAQERVAAINVQKYSLKLQEAAATDLFIDLREAEEFAQGHMKGARNVPISELPLELSRLSGARRVYLSCQSGRRSGMATQTLSYLGFADVVNVSGGYQAWINAGLPVEKS